MQDTPSFHRSVDSVRFAPQVSIHYGKPKPPPKKRRWLFWTVLIIFGLILGTGLAAYATARKWSSGSFVGKQGGFFSGARDLIRGSTGHVSLTGEESGVVRILLLGIGGEGHDGPYLSDTIIVAQLKLDSGEVSLTSVPRDYQVKLPNQTYRKVNAAFAEGFNKNKDFDEAGRWAREVVGQLSGLDIPYFAVIDFRGFEQAINQVDGIDVEVERTFTDYKYPDNKNGYLPPQTFTMGRQHLDGSRALIFSRSRHAAGPEGSDFSRSQRQQKVIGAFRDKVQQLNLVTDTGQIADLLKIFAAHFHTNLSPGQLLRLARIGQKIDKKNIVATSLDPITGLVCPEIAEESGAYILTPCYGKSTKDIQNFFQNALDIGKISKEKSVVWIATKDPKTSHYKRVAANLEGAGLTVWPITYSDIEPEESVLYQVNPKPATATYIKNILNGREVSLPPPNIKIDATRSDIILILGSSLPEQFTAPLPAAPAPKPIPIPSPEDLTPNTDATNTSTE